ncbi:NAD-dependent epimerase/dehydratase family protein [Rhizobium sp. WL3]|uniref:NAD-dependent epimerase/dehydratase family protein n=1 Tax=Rhizobium sp. WL3 TaxID=2603277 RepID=UPI001FEF142F|nr:NAD-dependent epimerase/dehydratase family protein [Rhizobium sp. WL3]
MKELRLRDISSKGFSRTQSHHLIQIPSYNSDVDWDPHLHGASAIIHLAARVHVMTERASDPLLEFRQANVDATMHLARAAARAGVRRFVFVSTIKVNGERTLPGRPFTADDPPRPQGPYSISKAEAEAALFALGRETGMDITIIRPPLVYGPGVRGNFRSLMKWAASGAPSIFSAVHNRRSFVHVSNLCDLLITVTDHPKAANKVFLVSDGCDLSTDELLTQLTAAADRLPRSLPVPPVLIRALGRFTGRSEAVARLVEDLQVDITKTCGTLDWTPPITAADALTLSMR